MHTRSLLMYDALAGGTAVVAARARRIGVCYRQGQGGGLHVHEHSTANASDGASGYGPRFEMRAYRSNSQVKRCVIYLCDNMIGAYNANHLTPTQTPTPTHNTTHQH